MIHDFIILCKIKAPSPNISIWLITFILFFTKQSDTAFDGYNKNRVGFKID